MRVLLLVARELGSKAAHLGLDEWGGGDNKKNILFGKNTYSQILLFLRGYINSIVCSHSALLKFLYFSIQNAVNK